MFQIVLIEPEIPHNTGNIARTCAAVGVKLHLVKPLGFSLDDKYLKRAGLDYWQDVDVQCHESFEELQKLFSNAKFYYATTKALNTYADVKYDRDAIFVFGKETAGLPEKLLLENKETCIRIPMKEDARSLNLSNAVAITIYEALRQTEFEGLTNGGKLAKLSWD